MEEKELRFAKKFKMISMDLEEKKNQMHQIKNAIKLSESTGKSTVVIQISKKAKSTKVVSTFTNSMVKKSKSMKKMNHVIIFRYSLMKPKLIKQR